MDEEDACLCFKRHATGKLTHIDDLQTLASFGFRGEALPSIASVAEVTLRTRRADKELGCEVVISAAQPMTCTPCACPVGTDITVERLFYNVPVRRKFLKSEATEGAHITHCVRLYALAYPQVHFELKQDGREIFSSPQCQDLEERINVLWTKRVPSQWFPLRATQNTWKISGLICPPGFGHATPQSVYFFLNQRPISHPNFMRALREAYRGFLPDKQYPSVFLFLEMPGTDVDINVHPTKREVRFKQDAKVCTFVTEAVRECLKDVRRQPFGIRHDDSLRLKKFFPLSDATSFCTCKNKTFVAEPTVEALKDPCPLDANEVCEHRQLPTTGNEAFLQKNAEISESMGNMSRTSDAGASESRTDVLYSEAAEGKCDGAGVYGNTADLALPSKPPDGFVSTPNNDADIHSSQNFSVGTGCELNADGFRRTEAVESLPNTVDAGSHTAYIASPSDTQTQPNNSKLQEDSPPPAGTSDADSRSAVLSSNSQSASEDKDTSEDEKNTEARDTFDIPFFALWQNRWAFFNNTTSLLVLDCKSAQIRLWYDRVASLLKQEQVGALQTLLFPHVFFLEDRQAAFFKESIDWLKFKGICLAHALKDTQFQLEALPQWVPPEQADLFVEQVAASLEYGGQTTALKYRFEPLLVRLAQRYRFEPLTDEKQVRALCRRLQTCENYVTDPLGNHIWNRLDAEDVMGKMRPYE